jgi:hypothetical protein
MYDPRGMGAKSWISEPGGFMDARDQDFAEAMKAWLRSKDPREPAGAIMLALYGDGFSLQYLGSETIDADELVKRVLWIAGEVRSAQRPR